MSHNRHMKTPQTPAPELAHALGLTADLYLKREDLHPYGSHKGRSIPLMIKSYVKEGVRQFVISSSGNAALAAIHTVNQHNKNNTSKEITLSVFVGNHITPAKLQSLEVAARNSETISIIQVDNPKQQAFQMDKNGEAKNLRQSTDDLALEGYHQLAEELAKIEHLSAVFIPSSSGTAAQALGAWFSEHHLPVQIHIIQTAAVHPIAEHFDTQFTKQDASLAEAIVDQVAYRRQSVIDVIRQTKGHGWVAADAEIADAIRHTQTNTHPTISPNSALSVAGLAKAIKQGWHWPGPVVCLITGP